MEMQVHELMTRNPACCVPETRLTEVARMFLEHDCGAIPVVESLAGMKPVGIITDRDLACRAIALGKNALQMTARDCMSSPGAAVPEHASLDQCCEEMEKRRVRRLLVVDEDGRCSGIVSQADIALNAKPGKAAELLREISHPSSGGATLPAR